jgi:hypothetical protein
MQNICHLLMGQDTSPGPNKHLLQHVYYDHSEIPQERATRSLVVSAMLS